MTLPCVVCRRHPPVEERAGAAGPRDVGGGGGTGVGRRLRDAGGGEGRGRGGQSHRRQPRQEGPHRHEER